MRLSLPFNPDGTSEGFKQFISLVRTAFPDVKYTVEDRKIADEGDKVMVRWEARGTHQGELRASLNRSADCGYRAPLVRPHRDAVGPRWARAHLDHSQ